MKEIVIIIICIIVSFSFGYFDGYFKRKNNPNYNVKNIILLCFGIIALVGMNWMSIIGAIMMHKPFHDVGYTIGNKRQEFIYIGERHWTDKILRKTFIWNLEYNKKFPSLSVLYFILFVIGAMLILESKYY